LKTNPQSKRITLTVQNQRSCGTCTKCCEGNVYGTVFDTPFYKGKPCSFADINHGCSIHKDRPDTPCKQFSCLWLKDETVPLWLKPDAVEAILTENIVNGISYICLIECEGVMRADVLSWFFSYSINNNLNFCWQVKGGFSWIGSQEFNDYMLALPQATIAFPMEQK
jgi:hypothetical protein